MRETGGGRKNREKWQKSIFVSHLSTFTNLDQRTFYSIASSNLLDGGDFDKTSSKERAKKLTVLRSSSSLPLPRNSTLLPFYHSISALTKSVACCCELDPKLTQNLSSNSTFLTTV